MEMSSETQVLVIGSGAAGMVAAVEAAELGANRLLLESESIVGGSAALSGGYVTLCETELQPGSRQELLEDLLQSHAEDCQEDLSRLYVETAPVPYRRLKALEIEFVRTCQFARMRRPWAHEFSGREMTGGVEILSGLADHARQRGGRLETPSRVTRRHADGDGRVTAVDVDMPSGRHRIEIGNGVVVASGGFTRSRELTANFGWPGKTAIHPVTGAGSRGDGLRLVMGLGAGTACITAGIEPTIPADPATGKGVNTLPVGGIALNKAGKRFCTESPPDADTRWMGMEQPEVLIVQIYDDAMKTALAVTMMDKAFAGYWEVSAPTLDALLAILQWECGVDAGQAATTVDRQNREVRVGGDRPSDRRTMVGDVGVPLAIDASMRVLNACGEPTDRLFAAGEVTGGSHGAGRIIGRNATAKAQP